MILQCSACEKVKKFGEWVDVPEGLSELVTGDVTVIIKTLCPRCQNKLLSVSPAEKK